MGSRPDAGCVPPHHVAGTWTPVTITGVFPIGVKEFFEHIERERAKDVDHMVRWYLAIGPLLTKVEGLVVHTNTGKAPKLAAYYEYWENKIYDVLTKLVLR